jgi:hypothetical protein
MQYRFGKSETAGLLALALSVTGAGLAFGQTGKDKSATPAPGAGAAKPVDPKAAAKSDGPSVKPDQPATKPDPTKPDSNTKPDPNAKPEGSALPEPPKTAVEIVSIQVGPDQPVKRLKGFGGTFITNSADSLEIQADAKVAGHDDLTQAIRWQITPPAKFTVPAGAQLTGPHLAIKLIRKGGNPTGAGPALSFTVKARVEPDGSAAPANVFFAQDDRDRLRQEYVDLSRAGVPSRDDLLDEGDFYRKYGRKYRGLSFDQLNTSKNPGNGRKYPAIPLTESLLQVIRQTEKSYGRPLQITSGFRNPVHQEEVHAGVEESHHQYGRAVDLYVPPRSSVGGKMVASEVDWLTLASAALKGGGAWIEPMTDCGVNTDACHVHVDVRPGGPQSRMVAVQGQVTDPSGNPVAGATVKMAGMPVRTNAEGRYLLKHILNSQQETLSVEMGSRGPVDRAVVLAQNPLMMNLTLPADPQASLIARVEPAQRDSGGQATIRLSLKNVGLSEAKSVKLAVSITDPKVTLMQVSPPELASIPAGAEGACNVQVSVNKEDSAGLQSLQTRLQVGATYLAGSGEPRTQSWSLAGQVDPAPQATITATPGTATSQHQSGGVIPNPAKSSVDLLAALAGLLLGALAGAVSVWTRPRRPALAPTVTPIAPEEAITPTATPLQPAVETAALTDGGQPERVTELHHEAMPDVQAEPPRIEQEILPPEEAVEPPAPPRAETSPSF